MLRLATLLYAIVGTSLAGICIIVALTTGYDTANYVIVAATLGAVIAVPVSYFVAKAIKANDWS